MTTDKMAAGGDVDEQPICALHRIFFTKRGEDCALCGTARRAGEGSQAAPPDALEKIRALRVWAAAKADTHEECGSRTLAAMFMVKRDTFDSVIDILKASAAAAGRGTFAEGIEAAAKIVDAGVVKWRAKEPVTFQGIAKEIRALAQEKREPAP